MSWEERGGEGGVGLVNLVVIVNGRLHRRHGGATGVPNDGQQGKVCLDCEVDHVEEEKIIFLLRHDQHKPAPTSTLVRSLPSLYTF
jgi:hypothetical protein